ncbi:hypothetical protein ABENE_10780 [Asticcacaulis benevestitus DSM 16100 = ATCC BAA-896]|uniref:Uncharacterized protein n=1 Tax=Asticcacaulis benevestitus DSM 16100 = ATCC BAA-896 TaxID=1121022 RepID=V4PUS6_9CAUL|nr:hypothetical protein ABENE_10780 [Asticcacaulis benevestitus DSM 16100 = ATCC BAA-896]
MTKRDDIPGRSQPEIPKRTKSGYMGALPTTVTKKKEPLSAGSFYLLECLYFIQQQNALMAPAPGFTSHDRPRMFLRTAG